MSKSKINKMYIPSGSPKNLKISCAIVVMHFQGIFTFVQNSVYAGAISFLRYSVI